MATLFRIGNKYMQVCVYLFARLFESSVEMKKNVEAFTSTSSSSHPAAARQYALRSYIDCQVIDTCRVHGCSTFHFCHFAISFDTLQNKQGKY